MLREMIQEIVGLAHGKILDVHGQAYSRHALKELPSPAALATTFTVHSLSGFVDYVGYDIDRGKENAELILVSDPREVLLMSTLTGAWKQRDVFARAEPFKGKDFPFGTYLSVENFVIGMQTAFVQDENTAAVLRLVGNLQAGTTRTVVDDGVSQVATVQKSVAHKGNETVVSPVELRPFRTFQDINQPASQYVLRLHGGEEGGMPSVKLVEVDDKLWKLQAVRDIKKHLDKFLPKTLVLA